jgi:hypothetical protein
VGAIAWGLYVLRAPADFKAQFGANSVDRSSDLLPSLGWYPRRIYSVPAAAFLAVVQQSVGVIKLTGLLVFAGAIGSLVAIPQLRGQAGSRLSLAARV